jgi:CheY-like chemotaxis protein/predicted transcriptional regulator
LIRDKKTLGSFSFDVTKRMLDVLSQHGISMKKTNLASKAALNYNVCLRYIRMLNSLGWIEVNSEVSITEEGKGVSAKLLNISGARASNNTGDDSDDASDVWPGNLGGQSIEHSCSSYLPLIQMKSLSLTEENQRGSHTKQKTGNSKRKTIMIVDDEEDTALIYEYFLSSVGYEVRKFIDPRSALCEYVTYPFLFDLLVLDIRMRDINGLQLYQSIKAINPECRVIFVSCLDSANEVVSILPGMRTQHIIRKPVGKEQFVNAVRTALVE